MSPKCLGPGPGPKAWAQVLGPWSHGTKQDVNISAAWGGGSGVFGIFFVFFGPGPLKNASEKITLRSCCPDFRAEISHGEPNQARDIFQEKCKKMQYFQNYDFNIG